MTVHSEVLTRLPLADAGVLLDKATRAMLEERMLDALKVDIPILNHLRASQLAAAEVVAENRLWLVVLLADTSQHYLEFDAANSRSPPRREFAEELREARKQMATVEWRTREGIGEGRAPIDGTVNGPDSSSTQSIRARVRKGVKGGRLWLPAFPYATEIEVGTIPSLLPRGPSVRIRAGVEWMDKKSAELKCVEFDAKDKPRVQGIPGIAECFKLQRDVNVGHLEWGEHMRHAMDTDGVVDLPVVLALDWVTGGAVRFQLQGVVACWPIGSETAI
jgi:hypothetical protein